MFHIVSNFSGLEKLCFWVLFIGNKSMIRKISFLLILVSAVTSLYGQSAEPGQIFNKYSSAEEGVNLFTGSVALNRNLVTVSSGNVSASVELNYSGNVSEAVANRNDIAPTSWVGLGWSLGHAKIICEDAGTMWLGDDTYYFVTAGGVKFLLFKKGVDEKGNDKWWIESLPYWKVTPITKDVTFSQNKYTIIVGWKLIDESGNTYTYGDGEYPSSNPNATEYTLASPHSTGIVGLIDDARDELFPKAWNLRRSEDLEGNYIEYEYEQFSERVLKRLRVTKNISLPTVVINLPSVASLFTTNAYTKECYLKKITSSQGVYVTFITKEKDFKDEFIDKKGSIERDGSDPDGFIDPLERRYLSQIVVEKDFINKKGEKVKRKLKDIDFCYKPLEVKFKSSNKLTAFFTKEDNSQYVKRLLTSVIESAEEGDIQKEIYTYYENDFDENTKLPQNIGALHTVQGNNCGKVEYVYEQQTVEETNSDGLHVDYIHVGHAAMGRLKNGTPYLVGLSSSKEVQVYHRIADKWVPVESVNEAEFSDGDDDSYTVDGSFVAGEDDWFIYIEKIRKNKKDMTVYRPYQWDGSRWVSSGKIEDDENRDVVEIGPGYIASLRIRPGDWGLHGGMQPGIDYEVPKIEVKIPWSVWGGFSDEIVATLHGVDDDDDDRKFVYIATSRNHFAVFYKETGVKLNSGALAIFSFAPDKKVLEKPTLTLKGLDDDNHYGFVDDNILVGGVESPDIISSQSAVVYHAQEKVDGSLGWNGGTLRELDGTLGFVDLMTMGDGYFALRHDDEDDMSLFEYDGLRWNVVWENEDMVHGQWFDPRTQAQWDAVSGNDFFVARRPYIDEGVIYNSIYPEVEYQLIAKNPYGVWKRGPTLGWSDKYKKVKKHVYAGTNWFVVQELQKASINNGREWKDEILEHAGLNEEWFQRESEILVLGGEYLDHGSELWTTLFHKKQDSFLSNINAFFVSKKIVSDPVSDKTVEYLYGYTAKLLPRYPSYDYVAKTPVVHGASITLPEGVGRIEKVFCEYANDKVGVAKGQVCEESFYRDDDALVPTNKTEYFYERYRGPENSWPGQIYIDQLEHVVYRQNHISTAEYYKYANELNGQVNSVKKIDLNTRKNISEDKKIFAAEIDQYKSLKDENRLVEAAAMYTCMPDCENGKIVSGRANKFSEFAIPPVDGGSTKKERLRVSEEWEYAPHGEKRDTDFLFTWGADSPASWEKIKTISSYSRNVATQVENQLGIKTSMVLDKGPSNIEHANVVNAGLDEILIMPGDTCGIENWNSCDIVYLDGRYFEVDGVSDENNYLYGRFSNKAVLVDNTHKLSGTIARAKKAKYRFSAWVQGADYSNDDKVRKLVLKVGSDYNKDFVLEGRGKWQYVEWTSDENLIENKKYLVSLSSSDGSEIRLQDVRFVPEDAFVHVQFWDKFWNKPIASLNNQGVATYASYDYQGRLTNSYAETSSRKVYLTSRNTYFPAQCGALHQDVSLKKLTINGLDVPITETPGDIQITVDNNTSVLDASWETTIDGQKVYYRMYEKGKEASEGYIEERCACAKQISKKFEGSSMVLNVAVSTTATPYTITINKSSVGWVDYGHYLQLGASPVFIAENDVSGLYFVNDGQVKRAFYNGSEWKTYSENFIEDIAYIGSEKKDGINYVFALPNFVGLGYDAYIDALGKNAVGKFASVGSVLSAGNNVLKNQGNFEGSGVSSRLYRIASNVEKTKTYVVYEKTVKTKLDEMVRDEKKPNREVLKRNVKEDISLVAKTLDGAAWVDCGVISKTSVKDVDLTVGPNNVPYVAYIGESESETETKILVDDPEGLYNGKDLNDIPDNLKYEYSVVKHYVILKHLTQIDSKNEWVGFGSLNGDLIKVNGEKLLGVKRIKLSSDGASLYMAALVSEKSGSPKYALKIFKLERSSNELNAVELFDTSVGSSTIAYLDEDNHFDIKIGRNVPYVAFENEDNNNRISVLKWNANKWNPVGRPAFAPVSTDKFSLDLAIQNDIPYVVFKESKYSTNRERSGKIVPMKYSKQGDKDLTISSIGDRASSELFANFRSYITNYQYNAKRTEEQIVFDVNFTKKEDVRALSVMNNGENVFYWVNDAGSLSSALFNRLRKGALSSVNIPLSSGLNEIQVQVWDEEGHTLVYTFMICRDYIPGFALKLLVDNEPIINPIENGVNSSSSSDNNSSSSAYINPAKETYLIQDPEDGSSTVKICIEKNPPWRVIVVDMIFAENVCLDYDIPSGGFILSSSSFDIYDWHSSSSSSNNYSSSSSSSYSDCSGRGIIAKPSQLIYIDGNCNEKIVDIIVVGSSSSSGGSVAWNSSSSCAELGCSNYMSSSSVCAGEECLSSSSSSSDCAGGECLSSSSSSSVCVGGECLSSSSSSSSAAIEHKEPYGDVIQGTAIPSDFLQLLDYKFIGGNKINFANNVSVGSGQYAANSIDVAAEATINGSLYSVGNVFVGNNAYVNTLVVGGTRNIQQGARIDNLIEESVNFPEIPQISFECGSENINVYSGNTVVLQAGSYEYINVFTNANITFEPGVYRIKSLYIAPNARVTLNTDGNLIQMWIKEDVSIGDRSTFKSTGGVSRVFIYGNGLNSMYVGVDVDVDADVAYPNGNVELAPKSKLSGFVWAKNVIAGANAVIK